VLYKRLVLRCFVRELHNTTVIRRNMSAVLILGMKRIKEEKNGKLAQPEAAF